ncbi:MAG: M1 family aminopeptidase, partial [Thermoanaerobaculia bacterium]
GVACGFWVKGPAAFTYRITDRFSEPVAARNLRTASSLTTTREGGVLEVALTLEEAVFWSWDLVAATPPAAGETLPVPFSPWARSILDKLLGANPARDLSLARANAGSGYVHGLLRSSKGDFALDVDPRANARNETLLELESLQAPYGDFAGRIQQRQLIGQPLGRAWWEPVEFPYSVTEVSSEIVNDRGTHVTVLSRSKVVSAHPSLRLLAFDIGEFTVDKDDRMRPVLVQRVLVDGQPAPFRFARGGLLVALPRPLAVKESVLVETVVEGEFAQRPGGDNYFTLGPGEISPYPEDGARAFAAYDIRVEVPKPFVPFASGVTVESSSSETSNRLHSNLEGGFLYPVVLAGKYQSVTEEQDGYKAVVSTYARPKEAAARRLAKNFFAARSCYENWFGVPYPFRELDILEINDWGFGVAPAGVIYITKEAFNSATTARATAGDEDEAYAAAVTSRGINERFAHEVAHGYFPHIVQLASDQDAWLSESIADYVSAICIQRTSPNPKEGQRRFDLALREWKSSAAELKTGASIFLADEFAFEDVYDRADRRNLLYAKGPLVLHAIRQEFARAKGGAKQGDAHFFNFIRALVKNFTFKPAETRLLPAILKQMTGSDWQPFFEKYVYGTEMPPLN